MNSWHRRPSLTLVLMVTGLVLGVVTPARADELTVSLGDGLVLRPYLLQQFDFGSFSENAPGGQAAGFNPRRDRDGARLEIDSQFEIGLIWDFGHMPGDVMRLFEAKMGYSGFKPFVFTAGIFKPSFGLESMQGAGDTLFLERASIATITRNIAAGIEREAIEARAAGDRYHIAVSLTAGTSGPGQDGNQRAVVARAVGLPVRTRDLVLHAGVSGEYVFRPASTASSAPSLAFSDQPELQIDDVDPALDTGSLDANSASAVGPELGLAWRRLWLQGEWYEILLARRPEAGGGTRGLSGWYGQAAWTLLGRPRQWKKDSGAWGSPEPASGFEPWAGRFGAVELGARYSTVDFRDVDGGRQKIVTVGVNWWPARPVRFTLEYEHAKILGGASPRGLNAAALRAQLQF